MDVIMKGTPEEIAALIAELQERQALEATVLSEQDISVIAEMLANRIREAFGHTP